MSGMDPYSLPWSCEAEQAVLGGLLIDPDAFWRVASMLEQRSFFDSRHGAIYAEIARLVVAQKPVDVVTVFDALGAGAEEVGGLGYLNALAQGVPSASNIRRYAEIVVERAAHRALMQTADEALTVARGDGSVHDKTDRIASLFATLRQAGQRSKPAQVGELLAERVDHYNALAAGEVAPGVATGLTDLDAALGGGMRPGKVIVIAARPGVGKTSLAQAVLLHAAKAGHPGMLLSQEMERTELVDRAVSNLGAIGYGRLLGGKMSDAEWGRLGPAIDELGALPLHIDDQSALTLHDIRVKAHSVKGLRLLAIDYLQLCSGPRTSGRQPDRREVLEELSRGIKALAKDLGLTVLLLSQLNREVEKRASPKPTLADLAQSGAIEQDADVIAFLHRCRAYPTHQVVACSVPKNRQGKPGAEFALEFQGHYQRWLDTDETVSNDGHRPSDDGFQN